MTTYKVWNGTSWIYIDSQNYDARYVLQSSKGSNSGVASLDSSGHIPSEQLPSSIVGAVSYKGTFDPTSGAPTPAAQGYYYVASGAGTISATSFATGDWLVYTDESAWDKLENSSASVTWSNVSDKPASYTPDTHDNTSHSVEYITVGGVTYEALLANDDIGTGATQVAAGNHTHSGYQPLDGDLTSIAGLSGSAGLLRKTAANTWSLDTNTYLTELSTVGNATNWDTASRPTFTGNALKYLRLNATADAFEFATVSAIVDIHGTDSTSEFTTGDEVLIYDTSLGENRKILRGNFFSNLDGEYINIHGTVEETTPASTMELLVYDPSVPANRRITRENFFSGFTPLSTFTALTDTPATYGIPGQAVVMNEAGTALEFATVASSYELPTASDTVLGGVKIGSGITIIEGVISVSGGGGSTVKVSDDDTTSGYLSNKISAGAGISLTVQNSGGNETLSISAPVAVYSDGDTDVTLPETPIKGQIYEYVGIGTIWTITANTGQQVRYLSETGNTITAGHGYACVMLVYLDDVDNTWLVKNVTGTIDITEV